MVLDCIDFDPGCLSYLWVKLYNNLFHQIKHVFCLMFWLIIRKQFNYDFLSRGLKVYY